MRAITRLGIAYLIMAVASNAAESGGSRSFEGVIAAFRIKEPIIKPGENLKVVTVYQNTTSTAVNFRYLLLTEDAEIFRKDEREPLQHGCVGEPAVQEGTLKPLETVEFEEEVYLKCWDHLTPGDYEIRFCYHLGVLPEEIQEKYLKKYPHDGLVVPWSDRRYRFTIAK